ncbi:hypothetical protein E4T56_gene11345 [Termitomyces sp. T112]|nr:hypothetical protein E4T56_gene11345 [Termitomyces sp. T112]
MLYDPPPAQAELQSMDPDVLLFGLKNVPATGTVNIFLHPQKHLRTKECIIHISQESCDPDMPKIAALKYKIRALKEQVKEELEENEKKEASLSSPTVALQEAKEEVLDALKGQQRAVITLNALQQENDRLQATLKEQERSFSVALKEANDGMNEVMDALQQEKDKIQAILAEKDKLYNSVLKGVSMRQ